MLEYLKLMMQLLLVPVRGWEDVSSASPDPDEMLRKGLYPLMGVAALSEFVSFFYVRELSLATVLVRAVVDFGAYFVSLFIARLIFDVYTSPASLMGRTESQKVRNSDCVCDRDNGTFPYYRELSSGRCQYL